MFCPNKNRTSMNFSRQVAEKSWTPRDRNEDPDELHMCRYDSICRFLAPSDDDNGYDRLVQGSQSPNMRRHMDQKESYFVYRKIQPFITGPMTINMISRRFFL